MMELLKVIAQNALSCACATVIVTICVCAVIMVWSLSLSDVYKAKHACCKKEKDDGSKA